MQVNKVKIITVLITFSVAICTLIILATPPKLPLSSSNNKALVVNILKAKPQEFTPSYQAYGRIETPNILTLFAQVEGEILFLNNNFEVGSRVNRSETIYHIDDEDYKNQLQARLGELKVAEANLKLELGEQRFAKSEYKRIRPKKDSPNLKLQESLMLRKPQLEIAKANILIATSNLELAKKNLERCKFQSKENYVVLEKSAYQGDFVKKGDKIGTFAHLSELRVSLSIPHDVASVLSIGQRVKVYRDDNTFFNAHISQIPPTQALTSQLQSVYLTVDNDSGTLIINEFVTAELTLPTFKNVLKVPLSSIDGDKIWLVDKNSQLFSKRINVIWKNKESIIIKNILEEGMSIVKNKVPGAKNGLKADISNGEL